VTTTYTILMPVYNDWGAVKKLVVSLDAELRAAGHVACLLLVNDGSLQRHTPESLGLTEARCLSSAAIIHLATNLGHQRAIAVALAHIGDQASIDDVVVMDSDGEDDPADAVRLVSTARSQGSPAVVFAERTRRSEGVRFRIAYVAYTMVFRALTGKTVRFGNFSFVPAEFVPRLAYMPELWNHYAAAVIKSRVPRLAVPTRRAVRLDGATSMNFVTLVLHGLSAVSVFSDIVGVRLLCASLTLASACMAAIAAIVAIRFLTSWAIPGWTTTAAGIAMVLFANALLFATSFVFFILSSRSANAFIPARDYRTFIRDISVSDRRRVL